MDRPSFEKKKSRLKGEKERQGWREREREMVRSKKTEKKVAAKRSQGPDQMGP